MASSRPTSAELFPRLPRPRYRECLAHRDLAAIVLAAGHGTRIAPLSARRPKPLLPLGLTTPLSRAVAGLRHAGIEQVVVNASHRAEDLVVAGAALDVHVIVERGGPLGTAGGVCAARELLDATSVVVWNGDVVADIDVRALAKAHEDDRGSAAILAVRGHLSPGEGTVGLGADGRVVRLRGQCTGPETHGAWFAAVHVLGPEVLARLPARGCLAADVYLPMLAEGARLATFATSGRWHDIGDLASYLEANLDLIESGPALLATDARVDSAVELDACVVGAGAHVSGNGVLREVVVWPGASVVSPRSRGIALDDRSFVAVPLREGDR